MDNVKTYIYAIKNLDKKYYLMPFLLFLYVLVIITASDPIRRFITYTDKEIRDYIIFTVRMIFNYILIIILVPFYPHASLFIQSTKLYQKVFKGFFRTLKSGFLVFKDIGKDIPDDMYMRGSNGTKFTISAGGKSKKDRVSDLRFTYGLYFLAKLFFKEVLLRFFLHFGIFMVSPILFLISVPRFEKKVSE